MQWKQYGYPNVVLLVTNTIKDAPGKVAAWLSSQTYVQCVVQITIFWEIKQGVETFSRRLLVSLPLLVVVLLMSSGRTL